MTTAGEMRYAFIEWHLPQFSARRLCSVLSVHPSGFDMLLKNVATAISSSKHKWGAKVSQNVVDWGDQAGTGKLTDP